MAELSAIPFNKLPSTDDGYTLLYDNDKVQRSNAKLSELVQSAVDTKTVDKLDTTAFSTVSGDFLTEQDLNGYATEEWVKAQNYITGVDLNGYATEEWVKAQNYITGVDLNGYATENWVKAQNYITGVDLSNYYQKTETSGKNELSAKFDNVEAKITALETILATYSGLWVLTNTPE